jgi:signal peptidase I
MAHIDESRSKKPKEKSGSFLLELPGLLLGALLIAVLLKTFVIQPFYIPSESMRETLQIDDRVLVWKPAYQLGEIERGDVVVFRRGAEEDLSIPERVVRSVLEALGIQSSGSDDVIKRVIGLPGDSVEIEDNQVIVNGEALDEPYISEPEMPDMAEITVDEGGVFVMGDHRCEGCSQDSRVIGEIPMEDILGQAVFIIWPLDRAGDL